MKTKIIYSVIFTTLVLVLQGCNQNQDSNVAETTNPPPADDSQNEPPSNNDDPGDDVITLEQRIDAASHTANNNEACSLSNLPEGFYWEIGDRNGLSISGAVEGTNTPTATQKIAIASASKLIYSTYVLQKLGAVRESDIPFLRFSSGYVYPLLSADKEAVCGPFETVGECAEDVKLNPLFENKFYYSAGHFQYHATNVMGLGQMSAAELTNEVNSHLGTSDFIYLQTNLAGGLNTSASQYAHFLQRLLRHEFIMTAHLGTEKVCASSECAAGAVLSPAPKDESWNYSLGHWVEDDPEFGDHAFSSAGALGFYPWIDSTKTWYGIVARRATTLGAQEGVKSLRCGRLIRKAWVNGIAVP